MTSVNGSTSHQIAEFKICSKEDFQKNGLEKISFDPSKYLCPDTDYLKDNYKLKNSYEQKIDRVAVNYQVIKCNPKMVKNCKKSKEIRKFLQQIYITKYFVEESLDFKKEHRPVTTSFHFHQQFQLNLDEHRDNNNFIRGNTITTVGKYRFSIFNPRKVYNFVDI